MRELIEVVGPAVDVRAGIEQDDVAVDGRKRGDDRRTFDAFDAAESHQGCREHSSAVASAEECRVGRFGAKLQPADDARVFLRAYGFGRRLRHSYCFGAVDELTRQALELGQIGRKSCLLSE